MRCSRQFGPDRANQALALRYRYAGVRHVGQDVDPIYTPDTTCPQGVW